MASPTSLGPTTMRLGDWARLRVYLLWAYAGAPAMPHMARSATTVSTTAWLIRRGRVRLRTATGVAEANAGEWMFPPQEKLSHDFSDDAAIISVVFRAHWPDDRPLYEYREPIVLEAAAVPALAGAARRLVRLAGSIGPGPGFDVHLLSHATDLKACLELARATLKWAGIYDQTLSGLGMQRTTVGGGDARVAQVQRWIESLPVDAGLDEAAAARSVALGVSQVTRLFVAKMGTTPRGYFESRRVRFACDGLRRTDVPAKQVAYQLGFSQVSHFSNWFRKRMGTCPRDFRRACQQP